MLNVERWGFLTLLSILLALPSVSAQTVEPTIGNHAGIDARALGMGGAFVGVAESTAALHWNPAGLTQTRSSEFALGISAIDQIADATLLFGRESMETSRLDLRLNHLGGVFPVSPGKSHLTFALGVQRIQNLDDQLDVRGTLDPAASLLSGLHVDETTENTGGIYAWRVGLAGRVSERVSLGGTLDIWTGDHREELLSQITDPDEQAEVAFQELRDTADRSYLGLGMTFGTLFRFHPLLRLGATLRMPMSLEVDEYWTQNTFERNDDGTEREVFDDGSILYDIRLPIRASLGLDLGTRDAHIAADLGFANWTASQYSTPPEVGLSNRDFQDFYQNVLQWRVGGEYRVEAIQTTLRAGYWRHPLAFTANTISDERDFWSVGLGLTPDKSISIDIAYTQGGWQLTSDLLDQSTTSRQLYISSTYRLH